MIIRRLTAILLAVAASGLGFADTIVMKDGTKYEGEVLSEDAESYTMAIQVTPTIKDERRLLKEDVESVKRSSPDDEAFEEIKDLVPTPDRLTVADYDRMINRQVKAFMEAFPTTKHKKQAGVILKTLEEERKLAESGALKMNSMWISAPDRAANAFEIDASILLAEMKDARDDGRYQAALRTFEEIDRGYQASESYEKAVALAKEVLRTYKAQLVASIKQVDSLIPKRKAELELLSPAQKKAAYDEIARRDKAYEALVEREKKMPTKWLSIEMYHKGPMEDVLGNITQEETRLEQLNLDEIKKAGAIFREAYAAAAAGDEQTATPLFNTLKSLRVPERYVETLQAKLEAEIAASAEPEPDPDDTSETSGADPDTGADPEGGMDKDAPDNGDPAENGADADGTGAESGADAPPAPRDPVEIDEGSSMKNILFIVMAVVLVIALIAVFAGGKKKK